jgi:hypothetical protein
MNEKLKKRLEDLITETEYGRWRKGMALYRPEGEILCRIAPLSEYLGEYNEDEDDAPTEDENPDEVYYGIYPFSDEISTTGAILIPCCYYNGNFYLSELTYRIDDSDDSDDDIVQSAITFTEGIRTGIEIAFNNIKSKIEPIPAAL